MINTYFFLQNKFQVNCKVLVPKITWSHICVFPLHLPRNGPDLDSFSDFLEKLETSFGTIFWYYVQHFELIFFQSFPGGVTNNFPLETPQNRPKNTNFFNIQFEYGPLCKNRWLRRWNFDFMYRISGLFFPVLSRGITNNFSLETHQKRPKNTNFFNIHRIKNWEYEHLCKNKY